MTDYLVPGLLLTACIRSLYRKQPVYASLQEGGKEGLTLILSLFPTLVLLMTVIRMLSASGALQYLEKALTPLFSLLGLPPETAPLVLVRPISGSAALAVGAELMQKYGPDSQIGRTAAVMLGSTETTFYTVSVYFGAAGIEKTRYTIPAALIADLTGFTVAALTVRLFF